MVNSENDDDNSSEDDDSSEDDEEEREGGISQAWKGGMATKAAQRFLQRKSENLNLQDLVYGKSGGINAAEVRRGCWS